MEVPERRPLTGILLKVCSVVAFVVMFSLIKASGDVFAGQIVFFRSLFAIIPVVAVMTWRKELATAFYTRRPLSHVARGLVEPSGSVTAHREFDAVAWRFGPEHFAFVQKNTIFLRVKLRSAT